MYVGFKEESQCELNHYRLSSSACDEICRFGKQFRRWDSERSHSVGALPMSVLLESRLDWFTLLDWESRFVDWD